MFANIGNLIKKLLSFFIVGADNTIKAIKELYCVGEDGKIHKVYDNEVYGIIVPKENVTKSGTTSQYTIRTESEVGQYYGQLYAYHDTDGYVIASIVIPYANANTNTRVEFDVITFTATPYGTAPGYRCGLRSGVSRTTLEANLSAFTHISTKPLGTSGNGYIYLELQTGVSTASFRMGDIAIKNLEIDGIPVVFEKVYISNI